MTDNPLELHETEHPRASSQEQFDGLVGIDEQKRRLQDALVVLLGRDRIDAWARRHHRRGLPLVQRLQRRAPLVLLGGDVGCGKTALATSVATPVAKALECRIRCFQAPSDIRGRGLVGEISSRITRLFGQAQRRLRDRERGVLILDEADDLGTSRAQMQAHHEDRAGLNVLLKQIDHVAREEARLAVVLITNRAGVLDPALRRRVLVHIRFERPDEAARRAVFAAMLLGVEHGEAELEELVRASRREISFTYSDLFERVGHQALLRALADDCPLTIEGILTALGEVEPSPIMQDRSMR